MNAIKTRARKPKRPPKPKQCVGYVRVSTAEQGKSGLGLEAQRSTLFRFAEQEELKVAAVFVEVASGKGGKTPSIAVPGSTMP